MKIKPIGLGLNRKKGFSLLEALLSIVVILAAGLGVVELFISADKKNKLQTTEQTVQQVASASAQLLSATYDPSDTITTADVINSGLLSQNLIVTDKNNNKNIQTPYGIIDIAFNTSIREKFIMTVHDLPYDQAIGFCQNMLGNFAILDSKNAALTKTSSCATDSQFTGSGNKRVNVRVGYPRSDYLAET